MEVIKKYAHFLLVIIYIIINLYFGNCKNILIFTGLFIICFNIVNIRNAIIISYIISICYGIYNNFYLLENFDEKNKFKKRLTPLEKENIEIKNNEDYLKDKINTKKVENKIYNDLSIDQDIKYILSEELVANFLEKLYKDNDKILFKKTIDIDKIKPIMPDLNTNKIKKMKKNKSNFLDIPIIISNDDFIIDGHYRWFIQKSLLGSDNTYDNRFINVQVVDMDIKNFIDKIRDFKIKYNTDLTQKFKVDNHKIKELKNNISNIRNNLNDIEGFYDELHKLSYL